MAGPLTELLGIGVFALVAILLALLLSLPLFLPVLLWIVFVREGGSVEQPSDLVEKPARYLIERPAECAGLMLFCLVVLLLAFPIALEPGRALSPAHMIALLIALGALGMAIKSRERKAASEGEARSLGLELRESADPHSEGELVAAGKFEGRSVEVSTRGGPSLLPVKGKKVPRGERTVRAGEGEGQAESGGGERCLPGQEGEVGRVPGGEEKEHGEGCQAG